MTIIKNTVGIMGFLLLSTLSQAQVNHPLDGFDAAEYKTINKILKNSGYGNKSTLYPLIELLEPDKAFVTKWKEGDALHRKATVHMTSKDGFSKAIVNLDKNKVESFEKLKGQPMVTFTEFLQAMELGLQSKEMIAGLKKRGLTPDEVFCLPLTAGNFFDQETSGKRVMKVPCYVNPTQSNFYAMPIEGLYATVDLEEKEVISVIDEGVVAVATDPWGYTQDELKSRVKIANKLNPAVLSQKGKPNYTIEGSKISWDIWNFRIRTDKRPGLVVSQINVNDQGKQRSVLYQTHLSEVFVPYMDMNSGWYWRTYMDSGEYGFGLFMTPLTKNVDCPSYATYLPAIIHDDNGAVMEIPDAICIFERNIGDPAWRHFEIFAQDFENGVFIPAEGRPETELVVRTASEVGNYDYLIDYRFKQNGDMLIKVGATGLDGVKGVISKSMQDATSEEDTKYGELIAPSLVAAYHSHYFNFKLDFDIDNDVNNTAVRTNIVAKTSTGPRKSYWGVERSMIKSEDEGKFTISSQKPSYLMIGNPAKTGVLGHHPAYMVHHMSVGSAPFDFENDPSMKRNAYIKHQIWNTPYDAKQRYAGGEFAFASDGSDTLDTWTKANRNLQNVDIVTWVTAGFHHIPRAEDWPVMSTEWKTIHIQPMNFFSMNPSINIQTNDK